MDSKEWLFQSDARYGFTGLYQDVSSDEKNNNPAIIVVNPADELHGVITIAIPADVFDYITLIWCEKRSLKKNSFQRDDVYK